MNIDKMIEQWEEKHSSLLDEYSKGNANNEVMQMYRSQMKNVLDFINQLKQVKNCFIPDVSVSVLEKIRQAFADYRRAEGCSCCRDREAHEEAEKRLAELLKPIPYEDGSGFDWWQYCTER